MKGSRALAFCCCVGGLFNSTASGAGVDLVPISADGVHTITGNEIVLEGGGQKVFLEIYLEDWNPHQIKSWQAVIDSTGYTSALRGTLTPWNPPCTTDGDCEALMGSLGHPWGTAKGGCGATGWPDGECIPAWIDNSRSDYVFAEQGEMAAVDVSTPNYRYGSTLSGSFAADPGTPRYAGTLALDVPLGTLGTFTLGFLGEGTQMQDENGVHITPLALTPALITVLCLTNSDCIDDNACTDDVCEQNGLCSHENNYDTEVDCCNPVDGNLTQINDGNSCTTDTCDPSTGKVSHVLLDDETPCDDGLFCNLGETCTDGVCGGGMPRDCDDQIECTEPDWCDEDNDRCVNYPDDTLCPDDGLFCNGQEYCNPATGCEHTGSPCAGPCDEENDVCLCEAPIVAAVGGRYLQVELRPPDSGSQAIVITPDCPGGVYQYVCPPVPFDIDEDGLIDENVAELGGRCDPEDAFFTPTEWGDLYVYGVDLVPDTVYMVQVNCGTPGTPSLSDAAIVTTPIFGDTVGTFDPGLWEWTPPDGVVNIVDAIAGLDSFRHLDTAPPVYRVDMIGRVGCFPDQVIDIVNDIVMIFHAFRGFPYTVVTGCPEPCP